MALSDLVIHNAGEDSGVQHVFVSEPGALHGHDPTGGEFPDQPADVILTASEHVGKPFLPGVGAPAGRFVKPAQEFEQLAAKAAVSVAAGVAYRQFSHGCH
jgi:hypothetical protein